MKVTPFRDKVMIFPDPSPEFSDSGLIVRPANWTQPPGTSTVIAVGPGRHNQRGVFQPTTVKPGDRVSYRWIDAEQESVKWTHEGRTYAFLFEAQICLVTDLPVISNNSNVQKENQLATV